MSNRFRFLVSMVFLCVLSQAGWAQEPDLEEQIDENQTESVEPSSSDLAPVTTMDAYREAEKARRKKICNCYYAPDVSYRERRSAVSGFVGFQGGTYAPTKYQPDFSTQSFKDYYGQSSSPEMELLFGVKWNIAIGSIGLQLSGGYYSVKKDSAAAELLLQPVLAGIIVALDGIMPEPYVVPYGTAGMYTVVYNEKVSGLKVTGNSPPAPYFAGGAMFQLNWIDKDSADDAYQDYGLENTYLFAEARTFLAGANAVPNMSTDVHYSGGLRIEF